MKGRAQPACPKMLPWLEVSTRKKWFCYGNKIRDNKWIFCCCNQSFAAATKRVVDRTKHVVVVTKYFCSPYFNKWFCWYNKTFYTVHRIWHLSLIWRVQWKKGNFSLLSDSFSFLPKSSLISQSYRNDSASKRFFEVKLAASTLEKKRIEKRIAAEVGKSFLWRKKMWRFWEGTTENRRCVSQKFLLPTHVKKNVYKFATNFLRMSFWSW